MSGFPERGNDYFSRIPAAHLPTIFERTQDRCRHLLPEMPAI